MKEWLKRVLAYLSKPPRWFLILAWLCALLAIAGALTLVFVGYAEWLAYPVYVVAAITLTYAVYTVVLFAPKIKAWVMQGLRRRKFTREMTESYTFRTLVFAACSFVINVGFVLFNTVFAFLTANAWYGALAGYYFLLSLLRGGVFYADGRAKKKEDYALRQIKNYRLCGVALLLLDVVMSVAVAFRVLSQKPTQYTEITAIVFATYSVYKITLAIWNIFKARRTKDLQIQSFRNVGLADAAVSLLSLQTTLISTFSVEGESMLLLNALTGAFVCLFTIGLGVFMLIQANKKLKEEGNGE